MGEALRDISRESCPDRPRLSHHLRPKKDGRGAVMVCEYCQRTAAQIRASVPTAIIEVHFIDNRGSTTPHKHRR